VRIGLSSPVVVQVPGIASEWERTATAGELAQIARVADELGFDYLTCSEHVAIPSAEAAARGSVYWDPLATLSFLAAHTDRIRLATSVLVLGYQHPLAIAKRYGTLDRISAGRLILGVGIGSLAEEFDLLNAKFDGRAARADDAIAAIRASMSTPIPWYTGPFYDYRGWVVEPCAQQEPVPIWVGGRTRASLRRAVRLADGWMPFGLARDQISAMLAEIEVPHDFEVVVSTGSPVDPECDPDGVRHLLGGFRDVRATAVTCSVRARSAEHYCEQLERLQNLVARFKEEKR
jgi:probable F420-dependent oxidoreductase